MAVTFPVVGALGRFGCETRSAVSRLTGHSAQRGPAQAALPLRVWFQLRREGKPPGSNVPSLAVMRCAHTCSALLHTGASPSPPRTASLGRTQETNTSPGPSWSGGAGGGGGRHGLPELASPASTLCPRRAFPRSTGRGRGTVFPPSAACLGVPAPALFSCEIEGLSPDGGAGTRLDTGSQDSPPPPSPLSALPALFLFFPANPSGSPPHRTGACWGLGPGNQVGCRPPREIWVSDKQLIFAGTSVAHILCAVYGSPTHGGWGGCQWGDQGPQPLGPSQPGAW